MVLGGLQNNKLEDYYMNIPNIAYSLKRNINDSESFTKLKNMLVRSNITLEEVMIIKVIMGYALMNTRDNKEEKNRE